MQARPFAHPREKPSETKGRDVVKKFIPREKLSKTARKALDGRRRVVWDVPPVTKKMESKKLYNRKKKQAVNRDDFWIASSYLI